jgi:hypothetical protein
MTPQRILAVLAILLTVAAIASIGPSVCLPVAVLLVAVAEAL